MIAVNCCCHGQSEKYVRGRAEAPSGTRLGKAAMLLGLALGLLSGCGSTKPSKYYQLAVPGELAPATSAPTLPVTIVVAKLTAPSLYREDHLVYSVGNEQMGTYEYQRWAAPPPEMIQQVLLRELRASDRYQGVYSPESNTHGDYTLHGRIYDFRELDLGSSLVARVTMDLELRDFKTGTTVWRHYYTHDEPVSEKTVPSVVAAFNQNVQTAASQVVTGLDQYFTAHPIK